MRSVIDDLTVSKRDGSGPILRITYYFTLLHSFKVAHLMNLQICNSFAVKLLCVILFTFSSRCFLSSDGVAIVITNLT